MGGAIGWGTIGGTVLAVAGLAIAGDAAKPRTVASDFCQAQGVMMVCDQREGYMPGVLAGGVMALAGMALAGRELLQGQPRDEGATPMSQGDLAGEFDFEPGGLFGGGLDEAEGERGDRGDVMDLLDSPVTAPMAQAPVAIASIKDEQEKREERLRDAWIDQFLFPPDRSKPLHTNIAVQGPEGSGKSVLSEEMIKRLTGNNNSSIGLINPKHIVSRPTWSFPPMVDSIEGVMDGVQKQYLAMKKRQTSPDFDPLDPNLEYRFTVIDEHDWCYEDYGKNYISVVRKLAKVGREIGDRLFLVGQSSLTTETGLSGSDYRQFGRLILGKEAITYLRQGKLDMPGKDEFLALAQRYQSEERRYALVIPSKGSATPKLALIPRLTGASGQSDNIVHLNRKQA